MGDRAGTWLGMVRTVGKDRVGGFGGMVAQDGVERCKCMSWELGVGS
jgi:hypothetical protein